MVNTVRVMIHNGIVKTYSSGTTDATKSLKQKCYGMCSEAIENTL